VPATQKVVSIFEPHTDIIRKDRRDTLYGHKVFLTGGASGLIVDCFVERGNPAGLHQGRELAQRAITVLATHQSRSSSMEDSAHATTWSRSKRSGIRDVAFSKAPWPVHQGDGQAHLALPAAAELPGRHRRRHLVPQEVLRWDRCAWRSYDSFRAYTWAP